MKTKQGILLFACLFFFSFALFAQQPAYKALPCNDSSIAKQADSIIAIVAKHGYTLLRAASIAMESEYEIPVIVPLEKGSLYHFVFIGEKSSKLFEVRMYDWDQNLIIYEKRSGAETNVLAFSYAPNVTLHHMFNSLQVNKKKKKDLCGYIMLFKKTMAAENTMKSK